jgi:hypothetical protein
LRPSKKLFYKKFRSRLSQRHYDVALDAASADFKNASVISANRYVGVDIDDELLECGQQQHYPGAIALKADVRKLDSLVPNNAVDLCISTHTISHLDEVDVLDFLSGLAKLNNQGGDLLFNMKNDLFEKLNLQELFRLRYERVIIHRYRNVFSRAYESFREDETGLFVSETKLIPRISNKLFYLIENVLTLAGIGDMAFVVCSNSLNDKNNEFSLPI